MCKVINFIDNELIFSNIEVKHRRALIEILSKKVENVKGLDAGSVISAIWEREQYGTTGIGNGVAIPHGRIKGINDIIIVLSTLKTPVDYESIDGEGVKLVFLLIVPEGNNLIYLKLLSQISIICNDKAIRTKLMEANGNEEILSILRSID